MAYPTDAEFEELVETLHGQMRALGVPSLVPAAILILRLKGKPYSLEHHYMFEPLFRVDPSSRTILKSARQVGKSQNLAASRLLKNIFMPYYNTLFVCPRFEQVKRISNLYMKPLINESLYKDLFVNPETCEQSILQRSFTSGSVQFFSFALLDAERIRSISASEVAIDESVVGTTEIAPGKCIVDLNAGDVIASFTDEGYVTKSVVNRAPSYHGRRRCFKVTSKSGAWVDGTMDHLISTSRGWLRIGEIIDYVLDEYRTSIHAERVPVYNRITTGGSQSESSIRKIGSAEEHPLSDTARIQPGKIPDIERVYKASTKDSREQGLREAVLSLVFPLATDLALFVRPGIPGREEDSDSPCRHGEVGREKTSIQVEEKGTQVIGSGVCGTGESTDASVAGTPERLELDPIVSIEYTGWQDVYDIEVVGTQTYFANGVASHNCQDINWDFIPIIAETLSGQEKWRYQTFTGTPKTIENTIERLWSDSSMAEWATKCEHCNKWNIACLEQDALMMLGDDTVVCAKCRRPIDPGKGLWLHKYPDKVEDFRGYHIPQIVHPYHWKNPKFWKDLLYKMRTYPYPKFVNECLGESFDSATKLMTIEILRKIERKEFINDLKTAAKISKDYKFIAMGIDWGGGGSDSKSFTSISIVGLRTGSDVLDTIYLKILPQSMDPTKEITEILHLVQVFNPAKIGHDYGGAGYLREVLLIHAGISPDRIMPFTYVVSPSKQVITYNPGVKGTRTSYSIDRSRSIITLCAMMKAGKVRTPNYESFKHELADFLVIFEDRQERLRSSDLVLIDKVAGAADDTVHSLNYACSTIWYYHQKYPNLAEANEIRLSKEEITRIAPKNITVDDWLQQ